MTTVIRSTSYSTWVVYDNSNGIIHGEFVNEWEAMDLRDAMNLCGEEWNEIDGTDYDWEE